MNKKINTTLIFIFCLVPMVFSQDKLPAKAQVVGDFVGVRNAPNSTAAYVGMLYTNMIVEISKRSAEKITAGNKTDYWYRIKFQNIDGWSFGGFLDFELKNKTMSTYDAPSDLSWFFNRYGQSTIEYIPRIDITSFTLDEYRSLITAVEKGPDSFNAAVALGYSIFRSTDSKVNEPPFPYLKEKIYSKEFLAVMTSNLPDDERRSFIPNYPEAYQDDAEFLSVLLRNRYSHVQVLEIASERLRNDKSFVMKALRADGRNLQFADKFKDDKGMVLIAVKSQAYAFQFSSERLRDDREVVLAAVQGKGWFPFASIPSRFQNDKEIILAAIKNHDLSNSYGEFPEGMRDDEDIARAVLMRNGFAYQVMSDRLKGNKQLAILAIKSNYYVLQYFSDSFKDDDEVINAAMDSVRAHPEFGCQDAEEPDSPPPPPSYIEGCIQRGREQVLQYTSERIRTKYSK